MDYLECEHDNVRAALAWSLSTSGDPALGLSIASRACWFWVISHQAEGFALLKRLLAIAPDAPLEVRGLALVGLSYLAGWAQLGDQRRILEDARDVLQQVADPGSLALGDVLCLLSQHADTAEESLALIEEGLSLTRHLTEVGIMRWTLRFLALHLGPSGWRQDVARSRAVLKEAHALAVEAQDTLCIAFVLNDLAAIEIYEMDYARAKQIANQALEVARSIDMQVPILDALGHLGEIAQLTGQLDEAEAFTTSLHTLGVEYGLSFASDWALILQIKVARDRSEYEKARELFAKLARHLPRSTRIASGLETLACVDCVQGHYARATQLFGAVGAERERRHDPWWPKDHAQLDLYINSSRRQLGEETFAAAWAEGRAMTLERAVEYALAEVI